MFILTNLSGTQVWVKRTNRAGGLNGHEVRLIVFDDGADPARHRAAIQEAVERRGVLAFLQNRSPVVRGSSVEYVNAKRIPVIGMTGAEDWAATSPMFFPQLATGDSLYRTMPPGFAQQMVPQGIDSP
jgi:branched-chain amino acid transport system substrate-binding protein